VGSPVYVSHADVTAPLDGAQAGWGGAPE
jgi:hypothetical protein